MKVLFTLLPGTGSLHPLLPLARELVAAGHEVVFCSAASFRPQVEAAGFPYAGVGLDYLFSEPGYVELLAEAAGGVALPPPAGVDRMAWATTNLFIRGAARQMLPGWSSWPGTGGRTPSSGRAWRSPDASPRTPSGWCTSPSPRRPTPRWTTARR